MEGLIVILRVRALHSAFEDLTVDVIADTLSGMARPLRVMIENGWYHVTARGNERQAIFRDDQDRRRFLAWIEECADMYHWHVHAYALMPNHYHLLVQTPRANLSLAMQWLHTAYSVWFNRRHRRVGHLFQGRF